MRHKVVELPLIPGALSDDTDLAAKLHAIDMDKVRSRGNRWETIKGWTAFNASGINGGTARGIHTYADLDGTPIVVAASETKVNAWKGGTRYDITPKWVDVWLSKTSNAYNGTDGEVLVTWDVYTPSSDSSATVPHYLQVGDSVTFSNVVQRTTATITLAGTFTITAVPSPTTFVVDTGTGTTIQTERPYLVTVAFRNGLATGTGDMISQKTRVWSIDNFGENAVLCGSDGTPIFYWQPETSTSNLISNGTFGSSTGWTLGTSWSVTGGVLLHNPAGLSSATTASFDVSGVLEGGKTYEMVFQIPTWQSDVTEFSVKIDAVDIFPPQAALVQSAAVANMDQTYTFRFVCPANPSLLKFSAGASDVNDNVSIDNVSIALVTIAQPLSEAPQKNYSLFVDGNRILNVIGSVEADGDFNAALLRWCDQDNYREWVPNTDNVAGEYPLGKGSIGMCGAQVGDRNLILTDDAAYTATFTANGYNVQLAGQGCGAVGQRALAVYNNRAFWPGLNGFFAFDGAQVLAIECPIKDRYVGVLKQYQENKTFAWINVQYGEVWIHYAHTSDGTEVSRYVLFNFLEQDNPWSFGTFDRVCFARAGTYANPIAIDASDNIWTHETGNTMSGSITLPFIETGYVTSEAGDQWLGCRRYYPDIESQTGNITWTITGKRAPQGSSLTQAISKTLTVDLKKADFLIASRQFKFKWASAASPTQWRLGVVGLEMRAQRERR